MNKGGVPQEVDDKQACIYCNCYDFDRDSYEKVDLILVYVISLIASRWPTESLMSDMLKLEKKMMVMALYIFEDDGIKVLYSFYQESHV